MFQNLTYAQDGFGRWAAELRDEDVGLIYRVEFNQIERDAWNSRPPSVQILSRVYYMVRRPGHGCSLISGVLRACQHSAPCKDEAHHEF